MTDAHSVSTALVPVILLLLLGILAAALCRGAKLSPIVGYLALGVALQASRTPLVQNSPAVSLLAQLGVVFLLFDIGLHFSLRTLREQASDIFGFGPVQVALGAAGLGGLAILAGFPVMPALLVGATLALSSTAVVARLITERHQQGCPVGLTATAILIFQDVAAIFLLIIVNALDGGKGSPLAELGLAVVKAAAAFGVAFLLARLVVLPLFDLIAATSNEEVFTASALLVALAASWSTDKIGLSLTLGGFLGGVIIAETPYRPIIQSETKPFRGLLLSFFFIFVGLTLDFAALGHYWRLVLIATILLIAIKIVTNSASSLLFRWSVPGSLQLGFLLAQGSEFAFVLLSLPTMRHLIGEEFASIAIAAVALSLALTPTLAQAGRDLAGRLRARRDLSVDRELLQRDLAAPVVIVGMGPVGRTVADALTEFKIPYSAIERDQERFANANADGYSVVFGDLTDPRIWEPMGMHERKIVALTAPQIEDSRAIFPLATRSFPDLKRIAALRSAEESSAFAAAGVIPVVDHSLPRGLDFSAAILREFNIDSDAIGAWMRRQQDRALDALAAAPAA